MSSYPIWREDLGEDPTSEETAEVVLASQPVALTELLVAIPNAPALERVQRLRRLRATSSICGTARQQ
jgi:hypothetical protein